MKMQPLPSGKKKQSLSSLPILEKPENNQAKYEPPMQLATNSALLQNLSYRNVRSIPHFGTGSIGATTDFTPDVRDFHIDENEPMRQQVNSFLIEPIAVIDDNGDQQQNAQEDSASGLIQVFPTQRHSGQIMSNKVLLLTDANTYQKDSSQHFSVNNIDDNDNDDDDSNVGPPGVFSAQQQYKQRNRQLEIVRQDVDEMGSGLLSSPVILYSESPLQDVTPSSSSLGCLDDAQIVVNHHAAAAHRTTIATQNNHHRQHYHQHDDRFQEDVCNGNSQQQQADEEEKQGRRVGGARRSSLKHASDVILVEESEEDLLSKEQLLTVDADEEEEQDVEGNNDGEGGDGGVTDQSINYIGNKGAGKAAEDASMASNSSVLSVPKGMACMRQQHLDTINEGNSSVELSESQSIYRVQGECTVTHNDNSSPFVHGILISDGKNQQSAGTNMLERVTRAKIVQRQSQLQENANYEPYLMQFGGLNGKVRDAMKKSILSMSPYRDSQKTQNELHLTGDLLASQDESFHYAPDFSLDEQKMNQTMLRCKPVAVVQELPVMKKASSVPPVKTNVIPKMSYLSPTDQLQVLKKTKNDNSAGMSRSLSSAGIQIEKARNLSGLTDEEETPVAFGNRQVGLKPSNLTYTTISGGDRDRTNSSIVKGNVIVVSASTRVIQPPTSTSSMESNQNVDFYQSGSGAGTGARQDTLEMDECDVFEEDAMTHATVFRETEQSGLLTRCHQTKVKTKPRKKPLPSQYINMPASTRLFQPAQKMNVVQVDGDSGALNMQTQSERDEVSDPQLVVEFKNSETNEVILRTDPSQAEQELKRLSIIAAEQRTQAKHSLKDSFAAENLKSESASHMSQLVEGILRSKMLNMKTPSQTSLSSANITNTNNTANVLETAVVAQTEMFKEQQSSAIELTDSKDLSWQQRQQQSHKREHPLMQRDLNSLSQTNLSMQGLQAQNQALSMQVQVLQDQMELIQKQLLTTTATAGQTRTTTANGETGSNTTKNKKTEAPESSSLNRFVYRPRTQDNMDQLQLVVDRSGGCDEVVYDTSRHVQYQKSEYSAVNVDGDDGNNKSATMIKSQVQNFFNQSSLIETTTNHRHQQRVSGIGNDSHSNKDSTFNLSTDFNNHLLIHQKQQSSTPSQQQIILQKQPQQQQRRVSSRYQKNMGMLVKQTKKAASTSAATGSTKEQITAQKTKDEKQLSQQQMLLLMPSSAESSTVKNEESNPSTEPRQTEESQQPPQQQTQAIIQYLDPADPSAARNQNESSSQTASSNNLNFHSASKKVQREYKQMTIQNQSQSQSLAPYDEESIHNSSSNVLSSKQRQHASDKIVSLKTNSAAGASRHHQQQQQQLKHILNSYNGPPSSSASISQQQSQAAKKKPTTDSNSSNNAANLQHQLHNLLKTRKVGQNIGKQHCNHMKTAVAAASTQQKTQSQKGLQQVITRHASKDDNVAQKIVTKKQTSAAQLVKVQAVSGLPRTVKARSPSFVSTSCKRIESIIKPAATVPGSLTASIVSIKAPRYSESMIGGQSSLSHRESFIGTSGPLGLTAEPMSNRSSASAKRLNMNNDSTLQSLSISRQQTSLTKKPIATTVVRAKQTSNKAVVPLLMAKKKSPVIKASQGGVARTGGTTPLLTIPSYKGTKSAATSPQFTTQKNIFLTTTTTTTTTNHRHHAKTKTNNLFSGSQTRKASTTTRFIF